MSGSFGAGGATRGWMWTSSVEVCARSGSAPHTATIRSTAKQKRAENCLRYSIGPAKSVRIRALEGEDPHPTRRATKSLLSRIVAQSRKSVVIFSGRDPKIGRQIGKASDGAHFFSLLLFEPTPVPTPGRDQIVPATILPSPYGHCFSIPSLALRPSARAGSTGCDPALRQNHPRHAGAVLPGQSL